MTFYSLAVPLLLLPQDPGVLLNYATVVITGVNLAIAFGFWIGAPHLARSMVTYGPTVIPKADYMRMGVCIIGLLTLTHTIIFLLYATAYFTTPHPLDWWLPYLGTLIVASELILSPRTARGLVRLLGQTENLSAETVALRTGIILIGMYFLTKGLPTLLDKIITYAVLEEINSIVMIKNLAMPMVGIITILIVPIAQLLGHPITAPNKQDPREQV